MEKLAAGDKVEIIYYPEQAYVGKIGKIVSIESVYRAVTHAFHREPFHIIEFDDGKSLQDLKFWQLRKL
jgi:hypothetical protein